MKETLVKAREFILTHARLLERRLFEVHFEGASPVSVGHVVRAYQNSDGGLGHALEPDVRCPESQPLFISFGLGALQEAGYRDVELATSICNFLQSISVREGKYEPEIVPIAADTIPYMSVWDDAFTEAMADSFFAATTL
ncbi:hypothetical protein [Paenibacillus alkalitolerans]|uniref:hypothetical protein n=1 Tax=Paenibacillus alkalitolerans TaxID=2799335 RepID=UPI0018F36E6A|nr:hypothetical protein [Paenibacillus alkalitolerans]